MKVSILTPVWNGAGTISSCLKSVRLQSHRDLEHILIDGGSRDGTMAIIRRAADERTRVISEPDRGLYDALNKGIRMAAGRLIGILNSDDRYAHDQVIERIVGHFRREGSDSCYGDLQYLTPSGRVIRHWKSSPYRPGKFQSGWMPPHPTFFVKKEIYGKYGVFNTSFRIAADYELMLRFLERNRISAAYLPEVLIHMRPGGISNGHFGNMWVKTLEDWRAWKINHLPGGLLAVLLKNLTKVPQFWTRPRGENPGGVPIHWGTGEAELPESL